MIHCITFVLLLNPAAAQPPPVPDQAVPTREPTPDGDPTSDRRSDWLDLVCSKTFRAARFRAFPPAEVPALHRLLADARKARCWETASTVIGLVGGPEDGPRLVRFITQGFRGEVVPPMYGALTMGSFLGLGLLVRRFPTHESSPDIVTFVSRFVDPTDAPERLWTSGRFREQGVQRYLSRCAVNALIISSHVKARERLLLLSRQPHLFKTVGRSLAEDSVQRFDLRAVTPIDQSLPMNAGSR